MPKFQLPFGSLSRRLHGAEAEIRARANTAYTKSQQPDVSDEYAAAMRGKARGLREAADVLAAVQHGRTIPKRHYEITEATEPPPAPPLSPDRALIANGEGNKRVLASDLAAFDRQFGKEDDG